MVLDNFPVVLTKAIELLKQETLLYTKNQQVAADQPCHKATRDPSSCKL